MKNLLGDEDVGLSAAIAISVVATLVIHLFITRKPDYDPDTPILNYTTLILCWFTFGAIIIWMVRGFLRGDKSNFNKLFNLDSSTFSPYFITMFMLSLFFSFTSAILISIGIGYEDVDKNDPGKDKEYNFKIASMVLTLLTGVCIIYMSGSAVYGYLDPCSQYKKKLEIYWE